MTITLKPDGTIEEEVITKKTRAPDEVRAEIQQINKLIDALNARRDELVARKLALKAIVDQII